MKYYAVIDTNVIVSALLKWNSVPGVVLQAVFNGFVVPVFNDEILNEYRNVLNRPKFGFSSEQLHWRSIRSSRPDMPSCKIPSHLPYHCRSPGKN